MLAAGEMDRWRRLATSGLVALLLALATACGGGGEIDSPASDDGSSGSGPPAADGGTDAEDADSDGEDNPDSDEGDDGPALDFDDGQQDAMHVSEKVEVTGTATAGALVSVVGRPGGATAGADGRFRLAVPLDVGGNVFVIRATAPDGTETTREIRIFRDATEDGEDVESSP